MWLLLAHWKHPSSAHRAGEMRPTNLGSFERKGEINVVDRADEGRRVITQLSRAQKVFITLFMAF